MSRNEPGDLGAGRTPPARGRSSPSARMAAVLVIAALTVIAPATPPGQATHAVPLDSPAEPTRDPTSRPAPPETVGSCLGSGQVWLVLQTDDGRLLRSECVGTPDDGIDALEAAGVGRTTAKGGYLCTLAGYPDHCPRRFTGRYWHYWHAGGVGVGWDLSTKGPADRRVPAGSIEGWCYNADHAEECTPPDLVATDSAGPRIDLELETTAARGWTVTAAIGVLAAVATWAWWRRRRP